MGVGDPYDIVEGVARGIDMFDCVLPTRIARNGAAFLPDGRTSIKNARFRTLNKPIQEDCICPTCQKYTGAYLHHLLKSKEILGLKLISIHNISFLTTLTKDIRESIENKTFASFRQKFTARFKPMNQTKTTA